MTQCIRRISCVHTLSLIRIARIIHTICVTGTTKVYSSYLARDISTICFAVICVVVGSAHIINSIHGISITGIVCMDSHCCRH